MAAFLNEAEIIITRSVQFPVYAYGRLYPGLLNDCAVTRIKAAPPLPNFYETVHISSKVMFSPDFGKFCKYCGYSRENLKFATTSLIRLERREILNGLSYIERKVGK